MPEKPAPLMAGTMSAVPTRVHVYNGPRFLIMGPDGQGCWTDPASRVILHKIEHVEKVLGAHGYKLDREHMSVSQINQTAEDAVPIQHHDPESELGGEFQPTPDGTVEVAGQTPKAEPLPIVEIVVPAPAKPAKAKRGKK